MSSVIKFLSKYTLEVSVLVLWSRGKNNRQIGSGMKMGKIWKVLTECGIYFALPRKVYSTLKMCYPLYCDKGKRKEKNETKLA